MYLTYFVNGMCCRYACRGLFERHKLLFSFHMCAKILEAAGKLNVDEYNFFLRGGIVSRLATRLYTPNTTKPISPQLSRYALTCW